MFYYFEYPTALLLGIQDNNHHQKNQTSLYSTNSSHLAKRTFLYKCRALFSKCIDKRRRRDCREQEGQANQQEYDTPNSGNQSAIDPARDTCRGIWP
jgi:hypothetical protein